MATDWPSAFVTPDAPDGFAAWAAGQPSLDEAWQGCERPDWLLWMGARAAANDDERRRLVRAGCAAALADRSFLSGLSPVPSPVEIAATWASGGRADALTVARSRVAAFVAAGLVAAVVTVPVDRLVLAGRLDGIARTGAAAAVFAASLIPIYFLLVAIRAGRRAAAAQRVDADRAVLLVCGALARSSPGVRRFQAGAIRRARGAA